MADAVAPGAGAGGRQPDAQIHRQRTPRSLFSQAITGCARAGYSAFSSYKAGIFVAKTWEAKTDPIVLQFATVRKGN